MVFSMYFRCDRSDCQPLSQCNTERLDNAWVRICIESEENKVPCSCTSKPTRVLTLSFKLSLQSPVVGFVSHNFRSRSVLLHPWVIQFKTPWSTYLSIYNGLYTPSQQPWDMRQILYAFSTGMKHLYLDSEIESQLARDLSSGKVYTANREQKLSGEINFKTIGVQWSCTYGEVSFHLKLPCWPKPCTWGKHMELCLPLGRPRSFLCILRTVELPWAPWNISAGTVNLHEGSLAEI